jgi:hypothetical protein
MNFCPKGKKLAYFNVKKSSIEKNWAGLQTGVKNIEAENCLLTTKLDVLMVWCKTMFKAV